jgi:hypothetical protein
VARCRFDGETLTYLEHGTELNIPRDRGLYEPSLTEFEGRYFLTLRADHSAYVTSSKDGLKFDSVVSGLLTTAYHSAVITRNSIG